MNDVTREAAPTRVVDVATPDGHRAQLAIHGDGKGPGLLWLPARGVAASKYRFFAAALAARGVTVALHDWRGTGTSSARASRANDWGYRTLLDDIDATRAALRSACGSGVSRDCATHEEPAAKSWTIGGHSLGAQLAALAIADAPGTYDRLAIVAGGIPDYRAYHGPTRLKVVTGLVFFRALSAACGYFPGPRIGFGGNESRTVMREWSRSGLTGRYVLEGAGDYDVKLASLNPSVFALHLSRDWLAPAPVVDALLAKLPNASVERHALDGSAFTGVKPDHFGWLREPAPVADRLAAFVGRTPPS